MFGHHVHRPQETKMSNQRGGANVARSSARSKQRPSKAASSHVNQQPNSSSVPQPRATTAHLFWSPKISPSSTTGSRSNGKLGRRKKQRKASRVPALRVSQEQANATAWGPLSTRKHNAEETKEADNPGKFVDESGASPHKRSAERPTSVDFSKRAAAKRHQPRRTRSAIASQSSRVKDRSLLFFRSRHAGSQRNNQRSQVRGVSAPHLEAGATPVRSLRPSARRSALSKQEQRRQQVVRFTSPVVNAEKQQKALEAAWKAADEMRRLVAQNLEFFDYKGAVAASAAAAEGYDNCIEVIAQSYGHLSGSAKQIARLSRNIKKMKHVESFVVNHAKNASRTLLDEVVRSAHSGNFDEAGEYLEMANRARPWANLRPVTFDDIAALDTIRPPPPQVVFPAHGSSTGSTSIRNHEHRRPVKILPQGSILQLDAESRAMHSNQRSKGRVYFRLVYHPAKKAHATTTKQSWHLWPSILRSQEIVLERVGHATLEVQVRPQTMSGLASLVNAHELHVTAARAEDVVVHRPDDEEAQEDVKLSELISQEIH